MYAASSFDALITCPFEVSHRIEGAKLAGHVVKCQKNHKNVSIVTCPLNAEHKIHSSEIGYHLNICNGRKLLEEQSLKDPEHEKKYSVAQPDDIPAEENWDNEIVPAYDPNEYMMKQKVIRVKKVEPPSVRKAFREEQRRHIRQLTNEGPLEVTPRSEVLAAFPAAPEVVSPTRPVWEDFSEPKTQSNQWTKVKTSKGKNTKRNT